MENLDCILKDELEKIINDYLNTRVIDEESFEKIGHKAYGKTHISYLLHNLEIIKDNVIKKLLKEKKLTEETYDDISAFFNTLENAISRGYAIRCSQESDDLESTLYTEDILPEILKPSAKFKDAIKKDYVELNEIPSIFLDPRACSVYEEIEKAPVEDYVRTDIHKAHYTLHYIAVYYYRLIKEKDVKNLYGIYWRMRYLNILILTAITLYSLKHEREFYRTLMESHSIPILLLDPETYQIANANASALEFYGYTKEEITSLKCWQINTVGEEKMRNIVSKTLEEGISRFRFKHRLKSGYVRDVEVYMSPIFLDGKRYILCMVYDVTKEEFTKSFLNLLKELEDASAQVRNEDEFLEKVFELLKKEGISEHICLAINKEGKTTLSSPSESCLEHSDELQEGFPVFDAFNTKSPIHYKNTEEIKNEFVKERPSSKNIVSTLSLPILKDGRPLGVICICSGAKDYFMDYQSFMIQLRERIQNAIKDISVRKELEYKNELFKNVVENTQIGVFVFDMDSVYYANKYFFELLGYKEENINKISVFDIFSPSHAKDIIEVFTDRKSLILQEFNLIDSKNHIISVKGSLIVIKDINDKDVAIFSFINITPEKRMRDMLIQENKILESILDKANFGAIMFRVKNLEALEIEITYKNRYFETMTENEDIKSCNDFLLLDENQKEQIREYFRKIILDEGSFYTIGNIALKNHNSIALKLSFDRVNHGDESLILCTMQDITEEAKIIKYFEELSTKDPLTGACNRRCLEDKLKEYTYLAKAYNRPLSVIMFDVDFFKHINDSYGHDVGDMVLKTMAEIVSLSIRDKDIFARYGGEEFVIVAPDTPLKNAEALAERLRKRIENYTFEQGLKVTCSFGVTSLKKDDTEETLLKRADDALYEAKRSGRNKVVVL